MARPVTIGIVIYQSCTSSMVTSFWDVLTLANQLYHKQFNHPLFHLLLIAETTSPINSFSGLTFTPHQSISTNDKLDLIYIPGFMGDADQVLASEQKTIQWISKLNAINTILTAACNGNFLLAASGALNHKRATTHWSLVKKFQRDYQHINLEPEKILVDNGEVISAAGVTACLNLALHLVQRFANADIALSCAKIFLVDTGRRIQTPYQVFQWSKTHGDESIVKTQDWLEKHYQEKVSLTQLAELGNMSVKTLIRRFKKATGETPQLYWQKLRIETAKRLLESQDLTFNEVTWQVGYKDVSSFHKAFKMETGLTPMDYRNKFSLV